MSLPFTNPSGRMMRGVVACYMSFPHACRPFRESLPSVLACRKSFPKRFRLCVLQVRLMMGGCCAGAAQRLSSIKPARLKCRRPSPNNFVAFATVNSCRTVFCKAFPPPPPPSHAHVSVESCTEDQSRSAGPAFWLADRPSCMDTTCQTSS